MILLNGRSLTPKRKIPLEAMSIQLKERDSTATMTPADMTGIQVNSWVRDETEPGKGIVWRVRSISQAFATKTPTVQLEHTIVTLKDVLLFGEHKADAITGNAKATTCTAEQAIRYILRKQNDWTLGAFDFKNVSNPYKFDGDTLFEAIETVTNSLQDAWWDYDFSTYPFKLNIRKKNSTKECELRARRNLKTITKAIDKSGMYTRFYPIGQKDLHIDGDYVEKNAGTYGVISHVETDQSITDKTELRRWAEEQLKLHAEPTVTIDVEGLELADATGEKMDRMKLGAVCGIPLPEYGTEINERIVSLTYQDKIRNPEVVKITLANNRTDVTKIIADVIRKGGRGGRASAKKQKEDFAWFEDTTQHVAMCAKGIIGTDAKGEPNWIRLTNLIADGEGIHGIVQSIQNKTVLYETRFDQNEKSIGMVVEVRNGKEMIKAGEICLAINESKEAEATIRASKIYLLGQTIAQTISADYISSKIASIPTLKGIAASFVGNVSCSGLIAQNGITIGGKSLNNPVNYVVLTGPNNNVYTLRVTQLDGTYTNYTFSRATTLSGQWSGNTWTVTASPQGNTIAILPQVHVVSSQGNAYTDVYVGTNDGSSWTNHGSATRLTMSIDGTTIKLKDPNNSVMAQYSIPLTTGSYTTNGTKTPGSGNVGFSSVTINVPNTPSSFSVQSSSSGTSCGSLSGATPGKYIRFKIGSQNYSLFLT